jgi:hypothetical protein
MTLFDNQPLTDDEFRAMCDCGHTDRQHEPESGPCNVCDCLSFWDLEGVPV